MSTSVNWYETEVIAEVDRARRGSLKKIGGIIARDARALCPVSGEEIFPARKGVNKGRQWTGRVPGTLKKSIRYRIVRRGAAVQVVAGSRSGKALTAFYAMWVEFGTRKMLARPFMRPAYHKNMGRIEQMFKGMMR